MHCNNLAKKFVFQTVCSLLAKVFAQMNKFDLLMNKGCITSHVIRY